MFEYQWPCKLSQNGFVFNISYIVGQKLGTVLVGVTYHISSILQPGILSDCYSAHLSLSDIRFPCNNSLWGVPTLDLESMTATSSLISALCSASTCNSLVVVIWHNRIALNSQPLTASVASCHYPHLKLKHETLQRPKLTVLHLFMQVRNKLVYIPAALF